MNVNSKRKHTTMYPSVRDLSQVLSSYGRHDRRQQFLYSNLDESTNLPLPKKKTFPEQLKMFLLCIPGNDVCPDCEVRIDETKIPDEITSKLQPWANVEYGSLICEKCASYHIRMNKKTSSILSLEHSYWNLPQIISVLEGGNENFIKALKRVDRRLERSTGLGFSSRRLIQERNYNDNHPFEYRYKDDGKAKEYKTTHLFFVRNACRTYGGDMFQKNISADFTSLTDVYIPEANIRTPMFSSLSFKKKNITNELPNAVKISESTATENSFQRWDSIDSNRSSKSIGKVYKSKSCREILQRIQQQGPEYRKAYSMPKILGESRIASRSRNVYVNLPKVNTRAPIFSSLSFKKQSKAITSSESRAADAFLQRMTNI